MNNRIRCLVACLLYMSVPLFAVEEREGFSKLLFSVQMGDHPRILTVPEGKRFVLLQINAEYNNFYINVDGGAVIKGNTLLQTDEYTHDFPDRCVVFEPGQELTFSALVDNKSYQIVGYFYNCNCSSLPLADINKDCKVDFGDLAIIATEWLTDNTV